MENTEVVQAIDAKIVQLEAEAEQLQLAVQRLPEVASSLDALRKTRALMAPGSDGDARSGTLFEPAEKMAQTGETIKLRGAVTSRMVPGSIAATAVEVLFDARQPLHIKELMKRVLEKRKQPMAEATLVSVLCGYVKENKIRRTAPSTYAFP
jgi:hypothetical protein